MCDCERVRCAISRAIVDEYDLKVSSKAVERGGEPGTELRE